MNIRFEKIYQKLFIISNRIPIDEIDELTDSSSITQESFNETKEREIQNDLKSKIIYNDFDYFIQWDQEINQYWKSIINLVKHISKKNIKFTDGEIIINKLKEIINYINASELGKISSIKEEYDIEKAYYSFIKMISKDILEKHTEGLFEVLLLVLITENIIDTSCSNYNENWSKIQNKIKEYIKKNLS